MTIKFRSGGIRVLMLVKPGSAQIKLDVMTKDAAKTMIAQFQDVMEDFFRVWPELREEHENGLI